MLFIIPTKMSINHAPFRDDVHHIKSGEENKKKIYQALCTIAGDVTVELLEKLNIENPFDIQQWTPLRVLHRRTLMKRPRTIFSVKAYAVRGESKSDNVEKFYKFYVRHQVNRKSSCWIL